MKTFLWTTLFWIVAAIAGLLCLGFGNLWTQVLENDRIAKILPNNLHSRVCDYDWVVASTLESIDWCEAAEEHSCYPTEDETESDILSDTTWLQEPLSSIIANQEIIYTYMQESFASINQWISNLQNAYDNLQYVQEEEEEEPEFDERERQRQQLQAQIEALQDEMLNLY